MFSFDQTQFKQTFFSDAPSSSQETSVAVEEKKEEGVGKKKKKKKKAASSEAKSEDDQFAVLKKFAENLNFKIFEEKYEQTED